MANSTKDPSHVVRFDPAEVAEAVRECEAIAQRLEQERNAVLLRAQTYRQLLQLHAQEHRAKQVQQRLPLAARFEGMKIGEAAFVLLAEAGEPLHGKVILQMLAEGGRPILGDQPMAILQKALDRDPRIMRVPDTRNVWQLVG